MIFESANRKSYIVRDISIDNLNQSLDKRSTTKVILNRKVKYNTTDLFLSMAGKE